MINLHNIKKIYGDRTVLDIENLTFSNGETVAIVGPNGSGKSTLLKIIADAIKTYNGRMERNGKILYLPQQNIPFRKSVRKNILRHTIVRCIGISFISKICVEVYVNILNIKRRIKTFSNIVIRFVSKTEKRYGRNYRGKKR